MSLFQGIEHFRGQLDALNIQVVFRKDGQLGVTVTPVVNEKTSGANPELAKPFALAGSAADMDRDFVAAMTPVATTRASLVDQATAEAAALKAVKKPASPAKAAAPAPKASGAVTFGTDSGSDDDGDAEASNGGTQPQGDGSSGPAVKTADAAAPTAASSLFDE